MSFKLVLRPPPTVTLPGGSFYYDLGTSRELSEAFVEGPAALFDFLSSSNHRSWSGGILYPPQLVALIDLSLKAAQPEQLTFEALRRAIEFHCYTGGPGAPSSVFAVPGEILIKALQASSVSASMLASMRSPRRRFLLMSALFIAQFSQTHPLLPPTEATVPGSHPDRPMPAERLLLIFTLLKSTPDKLLMTSDGNGATLFHYAAKSDSYVPFVRSLVARMRKMVAMW